MYEDNGKENGSYYIGLILGQWKRKWKLLYWANIGTMEKKMEATILG